MTNGFRKSHIRNSAQAIRKKRCAEKRGGRVQAGGVRSTESMTGLLECKVRTEGENKLRGSNVADKCNQNGSGLRVCKDNKGSPRLLDCF